MEVIDIGLNDLDIAAISIKDDIENISTSIDHSSNSSKPSVNFGPGIELLMNDKNVSSSRSTNVGMDDLDNLEKELNEASGINPNTTTENNTSTGGGFADLFGFSSKGPTETVKLDANGNVNDSKLGSATMESIGSTKTWDGFSKVNEVPASSTGPRLNDREKRRKKRAMLKKMEEWYDKGHVKHNNNYTMESDFDEVEDEYETIMEEKRKKDSVKLQGWWFTTLINSIEYGNAVFDPFGLNLDGWGEQINEDIESYEDIFSELHDKYKGGKMSPEISLLLRIGFSGAVLNITNKALSTATPGFNDVIKQSPELMKMFSEATVKSMSNENGGGGMDFVSQMLNADHKPDTSFGPPPRPTETQKQSPPTRPGMQFTEAQNHRPDIAMGRGSMFREEGVNIHQQQENLQSQDKMARQMPPRDAHPNTMQGPRPEMKGPQNVDLDGILSGLKTREVNIHSQQENDSMVSISSLKDAQNGILPKKTNRRKQRSDKNTISLDI
jgi:hypothetical protein